METLVVILCLVGLAVIMAIYVMRKMKGKLEIELRDLLVKPGYPFTGKVHLQCMKPVNGRSLSISLSADLVSRYREMDEDHRSRWREEFHEIHREQLPLEGQRRYQAGIQNSWDYSFNPPNLRVSDYDRSSLFDVLSTRRDESRYISWHLEAHLDAEGLDLFDSKEITKHDRLLM